MEQTTAKRSHSLCIKSDTTVTGVTQVVEIGEKEVRVAVGDKTLTLTGNGFNAEKLSLEEGLLVLSGEVSAVKYADKAEAKSFLKKLFK